MRMTLAVVLMILTGCAYNYPSVKSRVEGRNVELDQLTCARQADNHGGAQGAEWIPFAGFSVAKNIRMEEFTNCMTEKGYSVIPLGTVRSPNVTNVTLALPVGWERKPLTDPMIADGIFIYAVNRTKDIGLFVSATKKEGITNFLEYATSRREDQASRLANPQKSEILALEISGRNAFRFDVTGDYPKSGQNKRYTYRTIMLEGPNEIALLNAWSYSTSFEWKKEAIDSLAENVAGL